METKFAPAERASKKEIQKVFNQVKADQAMVDIVNSFPNIVLVLNQYRQVIFYNKALVPDFHVDADDDKIIGKRPGEVFQCIHADQHPGGCGTSEDCRYCGAVLSILSAMEGGSSTAECRLTSIVNGEPISQDLKITSVNTKMSEHNYILFFINDISSEKRREQLERVFFHDVLNTIGALHNTIDLITRSKDEGLTKELMPLLPKLSNLLLDEVKSQQELLMAERGKLKLNEQPLIPYQMVDDVVSRYEFVKQRADRSIVTQNDLSLPLISSDPVLMKRILGNMLKNALEASSPNDQITIGTLLKDDSIVFFVQNPQVMPEEAKSQIFKRSYTTKGVGRGVGTYSMRLLGEKYLKGKVCFHSDEATGTVFELRLPIA